MEFLLSSESELPRVTEWLRGQFPEGAAIGLSGQLGAGKTALVRQYIVEQHHRTQTPAPRVLSPSFVIHQNYDVGSAIEHFDLYRLENLGERELIEIGYFEALERVRETKGMLFVEWPEKTSDKSLLNLDLEIDVTVRADQKRQFATELQ